MANTLPSQPISVDGKSVHQLMFGKGQKVTTGAASAASAALPADATHVRLVAKTNAMWVCIDYAGAGIAALTTGVHMYLAPGNPPEYVICAPGSVITAIQDTAAGELEIMPCY